MIVTILKPQGESSLDPRGSKTRPAAWDDSKTRGESSSPADPRETPCQNLILIPAASNFLL